MNNLRSKFAFLGWIVSVIMLILVIFQYRHLKNTETPKSTESLPKKDFQKIIDSISFENALKKTNLEILRDTKNTVINMIGQPASPTASAKIYWNKETQVLYIDALGLPIPPKGKVYQVWAVQLKPITTKVSIGLLTSFETKKDRIFNLGDTATADAFEITLEPEGGSPTPTMNQLCSVGKN